MADWRKAANIAFKQAGEAIWLIGGHGDHLGQSIWLREIEGREAGAAPSVDLTAERARGEQVRALIQTGVATAVHDIADGGLLVTIAEMALAGRIGAELDRMTTAQAFGEDQGRYVVTTASGAFVEGAVRIGTTGGDTVSGVALETLRTAHEGFFPALMNG
jgi:phosphoribosylformylglycinamidine synthase